jgi:hypothetical protein
MVSSISGKVFLPFLQAFVFVPVIGDINVLFYFPKSIAKKGSRFLREALKESLHDFNSAIALSLLSCAVCHFLRFLHFHPANSQRGRKNSAA